MGYLAWCYRTGDSTYYWTESYTLSVTDFAARVSQLAGKSVAPSEIATIRKQKELDTFFRINKHLTYIPK